MRIAIVKLSALGDIVHAMIVLQFIKKYNQEILIDWFVEEQYKDLLEYHPHIHKVHLVNLKKAKREKSIRILIKELKNIRNLDSYDLVIDMQGLFKSALISWSISSKLTLGFDKLSIREKVAAFFYDKRFHFSYEENVVKRNFELIKFALNLPFLSTAIDSKLPFLYPSHKYISNIISNKKNNIVLIPGSSSFTKSYPAEKFAELPKYIDANFFIVWGDQAEKKLADKIKLLSPVVNVCEKLSLKLLISLISQSDLVIGGDTGPTHIAWALNVPSITIFGPTPGYRNSFQTRRNLIIESNSNVNPLKINKNDHSIKNIDVKKIIKMSGELLDLS
jgi:heptosyltransferase I